MSDNWIRKALVFVVILLFVGTGVVPSISSDKSYVPEENKDFYDMVIITCEQFVDELQTLVVHKNSIGITTFIKTTEEVYSEYSGVDEPEQIKYFIKDALETYGINYVLLVGNSSLLPVRYSHLDDGVETSFPSDLYYADIYNGPGAFEDWDSNNNGIFAEWDLTNKDILDLYPDVYLGRLPCSNESEVETSVNKIINYEITTVGDWFNTVLLCGGDTCILMGDSNEGERINDEIASILGNDTFSFEKLWASNENLTVSNINYKINDGVGFIDFSGIGQHDKWMTHPHNDSESWRPIGNYTKSDVLNLSNDDMLAVVMLGGGYCSDIDNNNSTISDAFLFHSDGGGIGVFGSTAEVCYYCGDGYSAGLFGYIETQLFDNYQNENCEILGELWCSTVTDYRNNFPVMSDTSDCKTIEEFILLGDPSLKIGGYALDYPVHNIDSGEDFNSIQDAVDDSDTQNGDTILVDAGVYYENVIVNKTIDLIGEDKNNTVIWGNTTENECTFRVIEGGVTISNCTLTQNIPDFNKAHSEGGIDLINLKSNGKYGLYEGIAIDETANNTTFSNCIIKNYTWNHAAGFWIYSNNNLISHCIFDDNPVYISDDSIGNNAVDTCLFRNMSFLVLELTQNTLITHNEFIGGGIYILGLQPSHFFHTFQNNTVNNKSLLYLANETGQLINDVELGQLILVNCSYFDISNVTIDHVVNGIELAYCCNVTIHSCNIEENMYGSSFYFNDDIMITKNIFTSCEIGIFTSTSTLNLLNNTITDNADGISISDSTTTIKENNISSNNNSAIILQAMDNLISHNQIISKGGEGILILHADNNTIHNNTIKNNNNGGIAIQLPGNNNTIYHNIFCNNVPNAIDYGNNNWDNGYPSGGNYWDDYYGNDADDDGIGDTPYNISGGDNQDNYPFMHPYGWLIELDVNQSIQDRGFPIRHSLDGDWAGAQNVTPTYNTISYVEAYLRKFGTPEFNFTVELHTDNPQGTLLDTLTFTPEEVPSSWEWLTLDFTDTTVTPGTDYFIVCPPAPSGVTTSFGYEWGYAFGNQYDDGAFWFTRDGGGLWRDLPTMYEFCFRTYGIML